MQLLRHELLILAVIAILAAGLTNQSPNQPAPTAVGALSMSGVRLGRVSPSLAVPPETPPLGRLTREGLTVGLDRGNQNIIELSGGVLECRGRPLTSQKQYQQVLGVPTRTEQGCTTWDLADGLRVTRYNWEGGSRTHLQKRTPAGPALEQ